MKLVFATQNEGKVREMRLLLADTGIEVLSAREAGVTEDPIEDGVTFEENALIKARFVAERTQEWAVADDSGICIDALGGKPGVHSARWTKDHVAATLQALEGVNQVKRGAEFKSAAALVAPDGRSWTFRGEVRGGIALAPRGIPRPKLPYDVIFIPDGGGDRTFAEMTEQEKNGLSHRGRAFEKLRSFIQQTLF